ncbi:MAG: penicillin-binding transpeptidase domain-containing protein [Lentihominibacter sp.]|jgi:stage V sporulation protein D (sporulation-specific penicillin-binding protein)
MQTSNKSRKNLIIVMMIIFTFLLAITIRVGWIQIVKGSEYKEMALQQQTKDTPIEAERGIIYDRNGEKLAVSVKCYTVYATPSEIGKDLKGDKKEYALDQTAQKLADILDVEKSGMAELLATDRSQIRIIGGIDADTADKIRDEKLSGITISNDTKRQYPGGTLAANVLGAVSEENMGQSGLELYYNKYLKGISGRWVNYTDTRGNQLSYSPENEKYYQAEDGYSLVTTIDEVVQSYAESALEKSMKKTAADRAMAIVMSVETGEILALAQTPSFDPNNPYEPSGKKEKAEFDKMTADEKTANLSSMWRCWPINDVYEPGSVFKLLTTSIALEEDVASMDSAYYCEGKKKVADRTIHCWYYPRIHGKQSLKQAVGNSCNPVFIELATKLGIEKFYDYMDTFGITGITGVDYPSEGRAILQPEETAGPVGLATIGFGQGIAVTPVQLVTAISSLGNNGKLMQPRLVKEIRDDKGKTVEKIEPEVLRQTVSRETADEICEIMEYVVEDGGGGTAAVDGYRVGGKTGTAYKAEKGGYSEDTYSSCLAMAPMGDPKITVLVVIDSPKGIKYGSVTAGPVVSEILSKTLKHLNIPPDGNREINEDSKVRVPDVVGRRAADGIGILAGKDLKYDMDDEAAEKEDFIIVKQYPAAGTKVKKGTKVYLHND